MTIATPKPAQTKPSCISYRRRKQQHQYHRPLQHLLFYFILFVFFLSDAKQQRQHHRPLQQFFLFFYKKNAPGAA
jgi:hypothetical protein